MTVIDHGVLSTASIGLKHNDSVNIKYIPIPTNRRLPTTTPTPCPYIIVCIHTIIPTQPDHYSDAHASP